MDRACRLKSEASGRRLTKAKQRLQLLALMLCEILPLPLQTALTLLLQVALKGWFINPGTPPKLTLWHLRKLQVHGLDCELQNEPRHGEGLAIHQTNAVPLGLHSSNRAATTSAGNIIGAW